MSDELDYNATAAEIRDAAIEFEEQLNWNKENDDRDYLVELESLSRRNLRNGVKITPDLLAISRNYPIIVT